uniref:Tetratricopeptide repeat protein n=1 Tax=Prasinoderma singulare TaxID=676789 RepID=A0A7S3BT48_9VIRI|mmetsp:Transcript_303/g.832  ORF Transcript_303/g.832 Transcript_303/m.832 type:complete len:153 (+) Transcript_303:132-590(+)
MSGEGGGAPALSAAELNDQVQRLKIQGKTALARHDFRKARDALTAAIELSPMSYKLHRLRSVAYACLQDYDASLADAERVIELQPNSTDGWYHKGFALYHRKDYAGAAHAFQEGLKLNPADRVLRQGFWDSVTLLSQHRVMLPSRFGLPDEP